MKKDNSKPKVTYKNDCVDLRQYEEDKIKQADLILRKYAGEKTKRIGSTENGLVNNALKKLATSYKSINVDPSCTRREKKSSYNCMYDPRKEKMPGQDKADLKSKSEISNIVPRSSSKGLTPSSPLILSSCEKKSSNDKTGLRNKFTMTQPKSKGAIVSKSIPTDRFVNQQFPWKDQRLIEKYSILKVPYTRSNTVPVFPKPTQVLVREAIEANLDISDKKTYLYDEGSDVDSAVIEENRKMIFGYAFENQFLALLFIVGLACGMALLASIAFLICGNDLVLKLLQPTRTPEDSLKLQLKYLGGGIIHMVMTVFRTLGRLFSIQAQEVYQPSTDYSLWNYAAAINRN